MTGRWFRANARKGVVRALAVVPAAPFLAARRRYDRTLRQVDPSARAPAILRVARLRAVPRATRSFTPPGRPDLHFVAGERGATEFIFWMGIDEVSRPGGGPRVWEALCRGASEVVEIGANIGLYTLPGALALQGSYRAYEPHPLSASVLRANLAESGVTNVDVHEAAVVAEHHGAVALAVPLAPHLATPPGATLTPDFEGGTTITVDAEAITDALGGCDLLKVDVEGTEAQLFRAGWAALARLRPTIMVEVHDVNRELRDLLPELLSELDANMFAMRTDALVRVPMERVAQGDLYLTFGTWDYLIVPADRDSMISGIRIDN